MIIISGSLAAPPTALEVGAGKGVRRISTNVDVNWMWYSEPQGIVSWNFKSNSYFQETVVLYRSGYYFGGAFWPIYVENRITSWATQLSPLTDRGIDRNSMPIGIVDFGNEKRIIAFLFTFDPGQAWSVLEGGFSSRVPPNGIILYGVNFEKSGLSCVGYDQKQVLDWDRQTRSDMKGYTLNPSNVQTLEVSIPSSAQYVQLFPKDSILDSTCAENSNSILQKGSELATGDIEDIVGNIIRRIRSF